MYRRLMAGIAAAIILQGCATRAPAPPTAPVEKPAPVKAAPPNVAILVSENVPAYSLVATALSRELGRRATIRYMRANPADNAKFVAGYKSSEHTQFVSIGLSASLAARQLAEQQVVFCQVFNYQNYDLVTDTHKGVSVLPSLAKTFAVWHELAPDTTDVGVISGPGLDDMIQAARAAAKANGITLHYEIVKSDKEYQFAYKQMADAVQGYWLLPDNRVLSESVLRDVMTFSVRNSKQVAVFSDELLSLGGLFSTASDYEDIAQRVLERLNAARNEDTMPGPDIIYPDKVVLRVNTVMARRLNLKVPEMYQHGRTF